MAMVPFFTRFKDLAFKEMRSVTVRGLPNLPDGQFGFLELYCDEPECDCRRVNIQVISPTSGSKIWATINYGWESLEFYETWFRDKEFARVCTGATLDPLNPQTENSDALLRLFIQVLQDKAYVERHYQFFKTDLQKTRKHGRIPHRKEPGRKR